jgi:MFS family permease
MGLMFLGQFLGPVLGPPIGGLLAEAFGWPSTFFFMSIVSAVVILELFFLLPETYRQEPEALAEEQRQKAEAQVAKESGVVVGPKKGYNPFKAVLLLKYPVVLLSSIETGMIFALMFSSK